MYGLKLGADDYVTKPFDLAELLARIEGILRRHGWWRQEREESESDAELAVNGAAPDADRAGRASFGDFWVDFRTWQAKTRAGIVELSRKRMADMPTLGGVVDGTPVIRP